MEKTMIEKEYIQLPPLKRETDPNLIKLLWVYVQLSDEEQKVVEKNMICLDKLNKGKTAEKDDIQIISAEQTAPFRKAIKEVIGEIIFETGQFACWLYEAIYVQHISVTQLIQDHPESEDLIMFMSRVFKDLKKGTCERN